jgi:hypothetical protein
MMHTFPKGYTCACGKYHEFAMWAYAHWSERLVHTCDVCSRRNELLRGRVISTTAAAYGKADNEEVA